jgi:NADH:ubiquinone oxidoreductase subunit 5 (subunit L)/multisubunit Na+/H+ antiporter MnhA subunit
MRDIKTTMAMIMAVITFVIKVIFIGFLVWVLISLVDVTIHNFTMEYMYSEWNIFQFFFNINE